MGRTISFKWPRSAPLGDHAVICDYCGVQWRRSQLRRDRAGLLYCPDEGPGRDAVALSRDNVAQSRRRYAPLAPKDGGNWDNDGPVSTGSPQLALSWGDLTYENSAARGGWLYGVLTDGFAANVPVLVTRDEGFELGTWSYYLSGGEVKNLALESEDLRDSSWNFTGTTLGGDVAEAPDGESTAELLVTTAGESVAQDISGLSDNTNYVVSAFFQRVSGGNNVNLLSRDQSGPLAITGTTHGATQVWRRGWHTFDSSSGGTTPRIGASIPDGGQHYVWGFQLEEGTFGSSYYVPTTDAAVTQPKDRSTIPTTASFLGVGWELRLVADAGSSDYTTSMSQYVFYLASDEYLRFVENGGVIDAEWATPDATVTISDVGSFKTGATLTVKCDWVNKRFTIGGTSLPQSATDDDVSAWTKDTAYVGHDSDYNNHFWGWISAPRALPAQELTV